jgi:uncharacterized protein (TIGR00369 family)
MQSFDLQHNRHAKGEAHMPQENALDAWLAQEREVFGRSDAGAGPGVPTLAQIAGMNGMEMMQAMLRGDIPYPTICPTLDFRLIEISEGVATFQGAPSNKILNPMGTIHGGWYATLLDSALGCAVHSRMPVGRAYATADLNVHLVRGIGKAVRVRATGEVVHFGRQMATAQARLYGPDGTLFAHATTTCLVFDQPAQK